MFFLKRYINRLRNISFWLFLVPFAGLILSLLAHNLLTAKKFLTNFDGGKGINTVHCSEINFYYETEVSLPTGQYKDVQWLCINSSKLFTIYKYLPKPFYLIENIQKDKKYKPGTANPVNPFIYGEVSISNIAKRFPINFVFKPMMFIASFLMIFYWLSYQKVYRNITKTKKINKFTFFGILSGVFLFMHVFFLGSTIDNDIFNHIRKFILILFILFEIYAQFFITRRLYINFDKFNKYISKKILNIKIIYMILIILSAVSIILILAFKNLDSKFDYILEWNFFLLLLIFYLLSALMWKKKY